MPYHCAARAARTLNDAGLAVKGARIAVFGVSYKPGVGDIHQSPALKIVELLAGQGAEIPSTTLTFPSSPSSSSRASPSSKHSRASTWP